MRPAWQSIEPELQGRILKLCCVGACAMLGQCQSGSCSCQSGGGSRSEAHLASGLRRLYQTCEDARQQGQLPGGWSAPQRGMGRLDPGARAQSTHN